MWKKKRREERQKDHRVEPVLDRNGGGVSSSKVLYLFRQVGRQRKRSPRIPIFCVSGLYYSSSEFSTALYPTSTQMYIDYLKQGHLYHDGKV